MSSSGACAVGEVGEVGERHGELVGVFRVRGQFRSSRDPAVGLCTSLFVLVVQPSILRAMSLT